MISDSLNFNVKEIIRFAHH